MDLLDDKSTQYSDKYLDDLLRDPITYEIFKDPVFADDGHVYEREFIEEYLKEHYKSPITKQNMNKSFRPAYLIKHLVTKYLNDNPDKINDQFIGKLNSFDSNKFLNSLDRNELSTIISFKDIPLNISWETPNSKKIVTLAKHYTKYIREQSITNHLIKNCVDINVKFPSSNLKRGYERTLFYYICKYSEPSSILLAISKGADLEMEYNYDKVQPIHIIARRGDQDMLLKVIEKNPEVLTHRDCKGNNLVHHLIYSKKLTFDQLNSLIFKLESMFDWSGYVELMIEHRGSAGNTVMHNIVSQYGFSEDMVRLVSKFQLHGCLHQLFLKFPDSAFLKVIKTQTPVSLNAKGYFGMSVLHTAIRYRFYNTSLFLLNNKVCVDEEDNGGETALHYAIRYFPQIVPDIIQHRINKFSKSNVGVTPLHLACRFLDDDNINLVYNTCCKTEDVIVQDRTGISPILYALKYSKFGFVKRIMSELPDLGNVKCGDKLLKHYLALYGDDEIVSRITSYKNLDSVDKDGLTILHHCILGKTNIESILKLGFNRNTLDKWGNDYVQFAAIMIRNNPDKIKQIVDWVKPNSGTVYVFKDKKAYTSKIVESYLKSGISEDKYEVKTISSLI